MRLDLNVPRRVHVVGVGGAGMSAIATVLARMGHRVSGSDLKPSAATTRLEALGVTVHVGHAAANLPELVTDIEGRFPALRPHLRGEDGQIRRFINF